MKKIFYFDCFVLRRKGILDICAETKKPIKILPFIGDLIFGDKPLVKQIRNIKTEELLGRDPIKFDNKDIKDFISGKVCMVTGGGGSIGSELVRQSAKYSPEQIIIVDIYENNAYDIQLQLLGYYVSIAKGFDVDKPRNLAKSVTVE